MAAKSVLLELAGRYQQDSGIAVELTAVGGVDAAKRIAQGERFDLIVLAAKAIDQLIEQGHVVKGSRVNLADSGISVAVPGGAPLPPLGNESAVKKAVESAASIGYSTGPSGVYLEKLFERWGIFEAIKPRIVQAPPGVPVASLVADGKVTLGFQQLSELLNVPDIQIVGSLPPDIQLITTFSGGVVSSSERQTLARELLAFYAGPAGTAIRRLQGMSEPSPL